MPTTPVILLQPGKQYVMTQDFDNGRVFVARGTTVSISHTLAGNLVAFVPVEKGGLEFCILKHRVFEFMEDAGHGPAHIEQAILDAEQSLLAAQANAEAAGAQYRHPVTLRPAPGYERLAEVFCAAHDQAAIGKGADRHANDLPFQEQRMQQISQLLDSPDGMAYQVCKKVVEGLGLPTLDRKKAELLGAINYLAGIVIFLEDREGDDEDVGDL